jgi:hypothetical protein
LKLTIVAAAAVALTAFPSIAQTVSLHAGETVRVRLDNGSAIIERTDAAEPMTKFEAYALWRAETQEVSPGVKIVPPGFIARGEGPPTPPRPEDNRLQLTMRRVPGAKPGSPDNTVLFIENGYGSMLSYRAVMIVNGRSASTDVCDAAPHLLGLEHWPYVIEQLDLSDFRLEPFSGQIQCR